MRLLGKEIKFILPEKGTLEPNGPGDPLWYYYKPFIGILYRKRIEHCLSLLEPKYGSILEVGYGSGILVPTLLNIADRVSGLDTVSDPERVKFNLGKIGIGADLKRGDICCAEYPKESFDLIIAISILEHVEDINLLVRNVHRLLKPNGKFLVGMPNLKSFMNFGFFAIGYKSIEDYHVTSHRDFLKASSQYFKLVKIRKMPGWAEESFSLYFSMLLSKEG